MKPINGIEGRSIRLSCAEQILGERPLAEKLMLVRDAGFDGIDLRWSTLAAPSTRSVLAEQDLPVAAIYSQLRDPCLLSRTAGERAAALDCLVERTEAAAQIGATRVIMVPIFGPPRLGGFDPLIGVIDLETALLLAMLGELAERIDGLPLTVAVESLNPAETHFLTDPTRAAAVCDAVGSPRIAPMVDTYHCHRNGQDTPAQIAKLGDRLSLVHLSDSDRRLPGEGSIDFGPLLAALLRQSYSGWLGFETRPVQDLDSLSRSVQHVRSLWTQMVDEYTVRSL